MRVVLGCVVVAGVLAGAASGAVGAPPATALAYAVFGLQRVEVGAKGRVQGDVGCLFDELTVGRGTRISASAAAPTISLGKSARASDGYFCAIISGADEACMALPNPLIDGPAIVLVAPGSLDVSAPRRTKSKGPLAAGAYRNLSVGAAAQVLLAGGSYQFQSIAVGSRAKLLCQAACDVAVQGKVTIGQAARLGAGDGVDAAAVVFRIAAQGERNALDAKSRTAILGTVYAPNGAVVMGSAAKVTGALVGASVSLGSRARVKGPGGG